jgi:hypothetical protein
MRGVGGEPVRVLFVFSRLAGEGEDGPLRLLARILDRDRYALDALPCTGESGDGAALEAHGVAVDRTAFALSFEDTVRYLAGRLPRYDLVVSCQDVADVYPALEASHHRPPLIEHGRSPAEARAGPKHLTARYVGACAGTHAAAAARLAGRAHHALHIADDDTGATALRWERLFREALAERAARPPHRPSLFASFLQGGFECSTHRRADGRRLDVIAAVGHDRHAEADYRQLAGFGMRTLRDGFRWHLVEPSPGVWDWSSARPMVRAARRAGVQVVWDLLHYGWPDDVDVWRPAFVDRFARFARAAARMMREETDAVPFYAPVNEISFLAWAGGDAGHLNPFARGRGFELKVQLARAALAAMDEIAAVDRRARFVHCDPAINVVADPARPWDRDRAEGHRLAQYQGWDMLCGRLWPQLGGTPERLDILGVNYYVNNQWILDGPALRRGEPGHVPFRRILAEVHGRYGRPLYVSETGIEGDARAGWLTHIAEEVQAAMAAGVPIEGLCLYPIVDHPGWDDDRACENGLLGTGGADGTRAVHAPLAAALGRAAAAFAPRPAEHRIAQRVTGSLVEGDAS